MTEEEAFLRAVTENPEDDTPRLIFADWLDDHDDPRGSFIRVQCELARLANLYPYLANILTHQTTNRTSGHRLRGEDREILANSLPEAIALIEQELEVFPFAREAHRRSVPAEFADFFPTSGDSLGRYHRGFLARLKRVFQYNLDQFIQHGEQPE